ncbi:hypothetical protein WA588_003632, partial [Blastocystis sp. NMH]
MGAHSDSSERSSYHHSHHHTKCRLTSEQRARRSIIVSNIPPSLQRKHIIAGFSVCGRIRSCELRTASGPGRSFVVEYRNPMSAVQAVTCLNGHLCGGSQLGVTLSQPVRTSSENDLTSEDSVLPIYISNIDAAVSIGALESLFRAFGKINLCKALSPMEQSYSATIHFARSSDGMKAMKAMNHFSLKGRPLQISDKRSDVVAEPDSVPAPVGVGYVDYRRKKAGSDNDIQNSCIVLVTGFSDGVDVRDSSTIQEIKRISVEHGKLKDIKYVEVNGEKRVFLRFANAYSANVASKGLSGILFGGCHLSARQYDAKQYV